MVSDVCGQVCLFASLQPAESRRDFKNSIMFLPVFSPIRFTAEMGITAIVLIRFVVFSRYEISEAEQKRNILNTVAGVFNFTVMINSLIERFKMAAPGFSLLIFGKPHLT